MKRNKIISSLSTCFFCGILCVINVEIISTARMQETAVKFLLFQLDSIQR